MTIATINMIVSILAGMKLNKITDKKVKTTLVNDYLILRKYVKEAEADRLELIEKFQSDWKEELPVIESFRKENNPVVGHDEYLEAERDANKTIESIFSKDVDVKVSSIPMGDFMSACSGEELTIEQLAFLQESGILE